MHLPTVARSPIAASVSNTTSVSCTVSIVSTVVVPVQQQLRGGEARRRAQRRWRVRGLHRPDAPPQPLEQRHVVGEAAEERLAEMDVRLDEAGQEVAAARVDDACRARRVGDRPDRGDPPVAHRRRSPSTTSTADRSS